MKYFLLALCIIIALPLSAQELTRADTIEIQEKAVRHLRQFEGLLNLISQPDEYFRKYNFEGLARRYYQEGSNYQIFRDSAVVIEDDLNPRLRAAQEGDLRTIKEYLKAFFALYEKSPVSTIFFDDFEVSPVQEGDYRYVEVFYDSEFQGRYRPTPDVPYPTRVKKATVRAVREEGIWKVLITDISSATPEEVSQPVSSEVTPRQEIAQETPTPEEPAAEALPADSTAMISTEATPIDTLSAPPSEEALTQPTAEVVFAQVKSRYRRGKTYDITLNIDSLTGSESLDLYRNDTLQQILPITGNNALTWTVPEELPLGSDYQFRFAGLASDTTLSSTPFRVVRKRPWALYAGATAGAAVILYLLLDGGSDEVSPAEDNLLPEPPNPE